MGSTRRVNGPRRAHLLMHLALGSLFIGALLAAAPARAEKPVLMVLYFDNLTGDPGYDVLRKGLADMLVTDLVALDSVSVVERDKLEALLAELKLQRDARFDVATRAQLGKLVGAKYQLAGSIIALAPQVSLEARLFDVTKGELRVTARAQGSADTIFELEQALVRQLADGIASKLSPDAFVKTRNASLQSLLAYSQAVDQADRGDAKGAAQKMAGVMQAAPSFGLAKQRYLEMLARLRQATARHEDLLNTQEKQLWQKAEAILARGAPPDPPGEEVFIPLVREQRRAFRLQEAKQQQLAYRILRGQLLLLRLSRLGNRLEANPQLVIVPPAQVEAAKAELLAYVDNTLALIGALAQLSVPRPAMYLEQADAELARQLKLGVDNLLQHYSHEDPRVALLRFVIFGDALTYEPFARVRPSLLELAPEWQVKAEETLRQCREKPWAHPWDATAPQIAALDVAAEWALKEGKLEKAVGTWQEALERFPSSSRFAELQAKVEVALGAGPLYESFEAAAKACDTTTNAALTMLVIKMARTQPTRALELAARVADVCGKSKSPHAAWLPASALQSVAEALLREGECTAFRAAFETAAKVSNDSKSYLATRGKACLAP